MGADARKVVHHPTKTLYGQKLTTDEGLERMADTESPWQCSEREAARAPVLTSHIRVSA